MNPVLWAVFFTAAVATVASVVAIIMDVRKSNKRVKAFQRELEAKFKAGDVEGGIRMVRDFLDEAEAKLKAQDR